MEALRHGGEKSLRWEFAHEKGPLVDDGRNVIGSCSKPLLSLSLSLSLSAFFFSVSPCLRGELRFLRLVDAGIG